MARPEGQGARRQFSILSDSWYLLDKETLDLSDDCAEECSKALCAASDLLTDPPRLQDATIRGVGRDIDTLLRQYLLIRPGVIEHGSVLERAIDALCQWLWDQRLKWTPGQFPRTLFKVQASTDEARLQELHSGSLSRPALRRNGFRLYARELLLLDYLLSDSTVEETVAVQDVPLSAPPTSAARAARSSTEYTYKDERVSPGTNIDRKNKDPMRGMVDYEEPSGDLKTAPFKKVVDGVSMLIFRRSHGQWAKGIVAKTFSGQNRCESCVANDLTSCQFVRQAFWDRQVVGWSSHCVHCMWRRHPCKLPEVEVTRPTEHITAPVVSGSTSQKRKGGKELVTAPHLPPQKRARIEGVPSRAGGAIVKHSSPPKRRPPGIPVGTPFELFATWPGYPSSSSSASTSSVISRAGSVSPAKRAGRRAAAVAATRRLSDLYS